MIDEDYKQLLKNRVARLIQFIQLEAPRVVINKELQLIIQAADQLGYWPEEPKGKKTRCVCCGEAFSEKNVFTEAGARETQLSGFCESCFDREFKEEEDEGD